MVVENSIKVKQKMATGSSSHCVCQYLFKEQIPEEFFCIKCSELCDRLTVTGCCGESFCYECISDCKDAGKPCPACDEENYDIFESEDHQQRLNQFQVFCNFKNEGCDWAGTIDKLDDHLDPKQGGCQYVSVACPLGCHRNIPKSKMKEHIAEECTQRDYTCQYCAFKASYQEVMTSHALACSESPNYRRESCKCGDMDDHTTLCCLQGEESDFNSTQEDNIQQQSAGNGGKTANVKKLQRLLEQKVNEFKVEDNTKRLWEFVKGQQEQNQLLREKLEEQNRHLEAHELEHKKHLEMLQTELKEQKLLQAQYLEMLQKQEMALQALSLELTTSQKHMQDFKREKEIAVKEIRDMIVVKKSFEVDDFTQERLSTESSVWMAAATYTQFSGYKYSICITSRGCSVVLHLRVLQGEFDHLLKWPLRASFAMELLEQRGGDNLRCITGKRAWKKPFQAPSGHVIYFKPNPSGIYQGFLDTTLLESFIKSDKLCCVITDITMYNK